MSDQQQGRSSATPSSLATSQSVCPPPASQWPHTSRGHMPVLGYTPLTLVGGVHGRVPLSSACCDIGGKAECRWCKWLTPGLLRRPLMDVNMAPMEVDQPPAKGVGLSAAAALCMEGDNTPSDWHLRSLLKQLTACLDSKPTEKPAEHYGKRGEGH